MNQKQKKNQRGSALLISLGILSLALILAMSFAFSARTSRQVAKVNADITRANLLAITAEDRILNALKLAFGRKGRYIADVGMASTDEGCLYPNAASSSINFSAHSWHDTDNHVQHYATTGSETDEDGNSPHAIIRRYSTYYDNLATISGQTFVNSYQPIYKNSDGTGTIIGRIAYVLLDETLKYDINRLLDMRLISGTPVAPIIASGSYTLTDLGTAYDAATHFFYQMGLDMAGNATLTDDNKQRLGVSLQEIWYSNRSAYTPSLTGYLGYTRLPWQSYTHLVNERGASFDYAKFTFFSPKEPESFAQVTSGNFDGEYHRFDLTGFEIGGTSYWDSDAITVTSLVAGERQAFGKETDTGFADSKATCIFSLAKMTDKNGVNVSKHVAANLKDYADSNNYATIDENFDFSAPNAPAYCGNEKVAYINEIPLRFYVQRVRNADDNYDIQVNVTGGMELANVFNESVPVGKLALRIEGSYTVKYTDASHTQWKAGDFAPTSSGWLTNEEKTGSVDSDKTYAQYVFTAESGGNTPVFTPFQVLKETNSGIQDTEDSSKKHAYALDLEFKVKKVIAYHAAALNDLTQLYDLAYWEGEKSLTCTLPGVVYNPSATTANEVDDGEKTFYLYASLEAKDPRCNHRSAYWDWHDNTSYQGTDDFAYASYSSWEAINPNTQAILALLDGESDTTGYDMESKAKASLDLKDISTNYIANRSTGKILSFWELGAIHRAEPFCTIRLSTYHAYADTDNVTYANGDAILLDQVKIGPAKFSYGKFNCNCQDDGNFGYFNPGLNPEDTYASVSVNKWSESTCVELDTHSTISFSRAANAAAPHYTSTEGTIKTDCWAEAVFARTANLFSTRSNSYTIFIVAQPLQELDGAGINSTNWSDVKKTITNPTSMDGHYFSILGTAVWQLAVVRDAWRNEFSVVYRENLVR
ncbi:MAG: hypothetical protein IJJ33_00745 [Victivallales bacterium]|nr:hypothetical protein [Victivallales bacterium]